MGLLIEEFSTLLFFISFPLLVGFFCPFIFRESVSKWKKWIPAIIFFIGTIISDIYLIILFNRGLEGFDDIVATMFIVESDIATIGSILGALFIKYKIAKRDKALES